MTKKKIAFQVIAFLIIVAFLLKGASFLVIGMMRENNDGRSSVPQDLLLEKEDSIDVVAIGSSDTYSSISPMEWWNEHGITGYVWANANEKMGATYAYLEQIYRKQTPKVVFIEVGMLFDDKNNADALESLVKGRFEKEFPIFASHRFAMNPFKLKYALKSECSVTKGYILRPETEKVKKKHRKYMSADAQPISINSITKWTLAKTVEYCQKRGSEVVLLSIICPKYWDKEKHRSVAEAADELGVSYLDLNLEMKGKIKWAKDYVDGGVHMNVKGAMKVSRFLGKYLDDNFDIESHEGDEELTGDWNAKAEIYNELKEKALEKME